MADRIPYAGRRNDCTWAVSDEPAHQELRRKTRELAAKALRGGGVPGIPNEALVQLAGSSAGSVSSSVMPRTFAKELAALISSAGSVITPSKAPHLSDVPAPNVYRFHCAAWSLGIAWKHVDVLDVDVPTGDEDE